jgi:alginate O-acetyltransferase complex protein AlgI
VFFLFPAFFPQIICGPIQRPEPFFAQMRDVMGRRLDAGQVEMGFRLILGGLMLKLLVGDRLAAFIEIIDRSHADYSRSVVLVTAACYLVQLYADFAGYTNIALGVGRLFGVEGPPNFHAPFAAVNLQEFWRRWHMSLTSWVTDYLFTPLSMSVRGLGQTGLVLCIMLNMIVIGLWHGFTVNFLVFGVLQGGLVSVTALIVMRLRRQRASAKPALGASRPMALAGVVLTFVLMSLSTIFWHSPTWDQAISILAQVLAVSPSGSIGWSDMPASLALPTWICMGIALYVGAGAPGARGLVHSAGKLSPNWLQYGVCLFLLFVLATNGSGRFVYGQF